MEKIDNGGAYAIKGFNYQKSVVVLIAVLHYLHSDPDFEIYVEAKDDIVVKVKNEETFIQIKSNELSLGSIVRKSKSGVSILEKNISKGDEDKSRYKLVAPSYAGIEELEMIAGRILTKGATVYGYGSDLMDAIELKLPGISRKKLSRSSIAITKFGANEKDAVRYITGIMVEQEIPVDNTNGKAALNELFHQIDERSAIVVESESDYEKKKFTLEDLSVIISHSYKLEMINETLEKLGFNVAKKGSIRTERLKIASQYDYQYRAAKNYISTIEDINDLDEATVIGMIIRLPEMDDVLEKLTKEAIAVEAYCQFVFERERV